MFGLEAKHVVITGAGGGIGRSLVSAFRQAGARVTACDRDADLLAGLDGVDTSVFELTDRDATTAAMATIIARSGAPAAIIGNAGFTRAETMAHVTPEVWDSEIAINLTGTYNLVAPALGPMIAAGGGSIVLVSSVNGLQHFGNPAYSAAKAALNAYARALAVENGRDGIRANCICPGSVRTPAWDHRIAKDPGLLAEVAKYYPLGRLVTPEEVANTAIFLASPLSGGITGLSIAVDAGLTAGNLRFVREILGG
ncbi:SDR family oxidoreductase [Kaistia dalseonensis]|uniref:NAD(P)-dependent dehydrogenase (Short-subunit alcohol dehydrogenase family) n=1 Tax=Kaistia dalseonensis TaxID=410840 RepID=A0ABU0H8U1_9HYPH|nr:SDR family oxidoreductase [Kaistia dalseonensis]MCX5495305.1 SDR family oxidoreductase [Kaistia dalseonensis]MDQ0437891.1 NAD(P)-dependent dehydrogenase (short-subunit alcohol dehydrogenase family) [Kaistia dalseonensis]